MKKTMPGMAKITQENKLDRPMFIDSPGTWDFGNFLLHTACIQRCRLKWIWGQSGFNLAWFLIFLGSVYDNEYQKQRN